MASQNDVCCALLNIITVQAIDCRVNQCKPIAKQRAATVITRPDNGSTLAGYQVAGPYVKSPRPANRSR